MSNCSNCYNGCTEIVSDRCVKYTGINVPVLGIQTGDSLSFVEQALITFLTSAIDGTGIKPIVNDTIICDLVRQYLPTCGDLSLNDMLTAIIKAACDLQEQVDAIDVTLATLNADYSIGCLTGVTASSDTHAIVQAVINKVCALGVSLNALALDLSTNYISVANIDTYISNYINNSPAASLVSTKMIPYVAVPYFNPDLSNFDGTGAGIGNWVKIYLCNGANPGVPDLRGRVLVGATAGMGGGAFNAAVDPAIPGNPAYSLGTATGLNQVVLGPTQIPAHTHANTVTSTILPATHNHTYVKTDQPNTPGNGVDIGYDAVGDDKHIGGSLVNTSDVTLTVNTSITNASFGGGLPHPNNQPAVGCYYIIYIP